MAISFMPDTKALTGGGGTGGGYWDVLRNLARQPAQGAWKSGSTGWGQGFGQAAPTNARQSSQAAPLGGAWGQGGPASYGAGFGESAAKPTPSIPAAGNTGSAPSTSLSAYVSEPLGGGVPGAGWKTSRVGQQMPSGGNIGTLPSQQLPRYVQEPTGTLNGPIQNYPNPTPQQPTPPAPTPTAPPLAATYGPRWRDVSDAEADYYTNQDPMAWIRQWAANYARPGSEEYSYLLSLAPQIQADYLRASEQDQDLMLTDYVGTRLASRYLDRFANQPGRLRGVNSPAQTPRVAW